MPYMIRPTEKPVIVDSAEKKGESKREKDSQEKTNRAKNVIQCLDMSPLAVCVPDKSQALPRRLRPGHERVSNCYNLN